MRILSISTTILLTGMLALPAAAQGTLPRPGKDGMITLRQTADGRFVKGPAIPALPPH